MLFFPIALATADTLCLVLLLLLLFFPFFLFSSLFWINSCAHQRQQNWKTIRYSRRERERSETVCLSFIPFLNSFSHRHTYVIYKVKMNIFNSKKRKKNVLALITESSSTIFFLLFFYFLPYIPHTDTIGYSHSNRRAGLSASQVWVGIRMQMPSAHTQAAECCAVSRIYIYARARGSR